MNGCWNSDKECVVTQDQELIRRFNAGDTEALKAIYIRYKTDLMAVARALLNDQTLVEDVLHDVFVQFAGQAGHFRLKGALKAYLAICAANRARNMNRAARPLTAERLGSVGSETPHTPAQTASHVEQHRVVSLALAQLPDPQRRVIVLHVLGALRFREIAKTHEESIHTVQSRYRYGLKKLKSLLNGQISHD